MRVRVVEGTAVGTSVDTAVVVSHFVAGHLPGRCRFKDAAFKDAAFAECGSRLRWVEGESEYGKEEDVEKEEVEGGHWSLWGQEGSGEEGGAVRKGPIWTI